MGTNPAKGDRHRVSKEKFEVSLREIEIPAGTKVPASTSLAEAVRLLCHQKLECLLFGEKGGKLEGLLTERDIISRGLPLLKERGSEFFELTAEAIMTPNPQTLKLDNTVHEAIHLMARGGFRHFPVEGDNDYLVLSAGDLLSFVADLFPEETKEQGTKFSWDVMEVIPHGEDFEFHPNSNDEISGNIFFHPLKKAVYDEALCCDVNDKITNVLERMQYKKMGSVVVTQYELMVRGIFTERDFMRLLEKYDWEKLKKTKIQDVMTKDPNSLLERHIISYALNNMILCGHRRSVIVNEDKYPISVISMMDLLKFLNYQLFEAEAKTPGVDN